MKLWRISQADVENRISAGIGKPGQPEVISALEWPTAKTQLATTEPRLQNYN